MSKFPDQKYYNLFPKVPSTPLCRGDQDALSTSFFSRADLKSKSIEELVLYIHDPNYRQEAISVLCKRREYPEIGLLLWNTPGLAYIILEYILEVLKKLEPGVLDIKDSNNTCNALALMQSMASHPDVKMAFIKARMPMYLLPLLHTTCREKPFEYLRLTSLGVIGALVKVEDTHTTDIVHFLLESEMLPLCLRCMEYGEELSKTVASFILSKILMQEEGLSYCCSTAEKFYAVAHSMSTMIDAMGNIPSTRLLKHLVQCYLSLSEMPRACAALKGRFPPQLRDPVFMQKTAEDPFVGRMLQQLYNKINTGHAYKPTPIGLPSSQ